MAVLRQDVERTRELLNRERDHRLKVVLPKRFQLREVRVLPLALTTSSRPRRRTSRR